MSIAKRLYLLMAVVLLAIILLIVVTIAQIGKVFETTNFSNTHVVPSLVDLDNAGSAVNEARVMIWQSLSVGESEKKVQLHKKIADAETRALQALDRYQRFDVTGEEDAAMLADDNKAFGEFRRLKDSVLKIEEESGTDAARAYLFQNQAVVNHVAEVIEAHRRLNIEQGRQSAELAEKEQSSAVWLSVLIGILALGICGAMCLTLARKIGASLRDAIGVAEQVASGDLSQPINSAGSDEIAQLMGSLQSMSGSLVHICSEIRLSTDAIATAAGEIASGNMDLSARTEQQAGALEQTASSMEQLTSTVRQNSDNAQQASTLARRASELALDGGGVVGQVIHTMGEINESAGKIVDIISVIDGIAFQTNILALNAAVEAARAGEQGRGFAVVAAEVRNLAQRSASAAKEIKALIDDSVQKVNTGTQLVDQAGSAMSGIVDGIQKVSDVVSEISSASREQSAGIEQINQAVVHMDETTQQNAALVEQAAAAASAMREQSENLTELVAFFKLNNTGPQTAASPALRLHGQAGDSGRSAVLENRQATRLLRKL